jgi:hypothetical protein
LSFNQRVSAWRSPFATSSVTAGFQIGVDGCAYRETPSLFERQHLRVLDSFIAVKAQANDCCLFHDDSTYEWVGLYLTFTLGRQFKSEIQKIQIEILFVTDSLILGHDFHPKIHQQIRAQQSSAST